MRSLAAGGSTNRLTLAHTYFHGRETQCMERRSLLTISATLMGGLLAGCLGDAVRQDDASEPQAGEHTDTDMTDSGNGDESPDRTEPTDSSSSDPRTDGGPTIGEMSFEVLGKSNAAEESTTVTFDDGSVTVSGTVMGNNACYTARLGDMMIEDGTFVVDIESYENAGEDEGCATVIVFIEYEAIVEIHGPLPESVRVEHNGKEVKTEERS